MSNSSENRRSFLNSFRVEEDFTNRQIVRVVCAALVYMVFATFMLCLFFTYNVNPTLNPSIETAQLGKPSLLSFPQDFQNQWAASEQLRGAVKVWITGTLGMTAIFAVAVGLVLSRKLAGPIYHLKKDLLRMQNGEAVFPIILRDGDELRDVADVLNETLAAIESRHVEQCASGTTGQMVSEETIANIAAMKAQLRSLPSLVEPSEQLTSWAAQMSDMLDKAESGQAS